ncbi:MAG: DUF6788 family protein [Acidimicrobiales bacterium]
MTKRRLSPDELEARLQACRADYEAAKARIAEVGFVCEGSLVQRYTTCNNPNCRCADPGQRHGPYWQLSWKEDGRTVSRLISPEAAELYRGWIANRRRLEAVLTQMRDLSRQATEYLAAQAGVNFEGPPRRRRRSHRTR